MTRATKHRHAGQFDRQPDGKITLDHDGRHLRRKLLTADNGEEVLVDFPAAIALGHGDVLELEDGRLIAVVAAVEDLYQVTADTRTELMQLAWHLGNRHLPAQLEENRILIKRDHVIHDMLVGLGATISEVSEIFTPVRGAYHSSSHSHAHG